MKKKKEAKEEPKKLAVYCDHIWSEPVHHFWDGFGNAVNRPKTCVRCGWVWHPFDLEPKEKIGYTDNSSQGCTIVWGPRYL